MRLQLLAQRRFSCARRQVAGMPAANARGGAVAADARTAPQGPAVGRGRAAGACARPLSPARAPRQRRLWRGVARARPAAAPRGRGQANRARGGGRRRASNPRGAGRGAARAPGDRRAVRGLRRGRRVLPDLRAGAWANARSTDRVRDARRPPGPGDRRRAVRRAHARARARGDPSRRQAAERARARSLRRRPPVQLRVGGPS